MLIANMVFARNGMVRCILHMWGVPHPRRIFMHKSHVLSWWNTLLMCHHPSEICKYAMVSRRTAPTMLSDTIERARYETSSAPTVSYAAQWLTLSHKSSAVGNWFCVGLSSRNNFHSVPVCQYEISLHTLRIDREFELCCLHMCSMNGIHAG